MPSIAVVVNPAAGRGRGARLLPTVRAAFAAVGVTRIALTRAPGNEAELTRRAIAEGCDTVVAVGGDGTWSNVADAILRDGADCRLGLVAAGSGNDFAKSVGAPAGDPSATARLAVDGPELRVDVGRVEGRAFLNVCGFGFDVTVLREMERIPALRASALYAAAAARQLFAYRGEEVTVDPPGAPRKHLLLAIANGRRFGRGFRIAPSASLTDGLLDAVAIGAAAPLRRVRLLAAALRGAHTAFPEVCTRQAAEFLLAFSAPPIYETDGELRQARTAELRVSCLPRALRVVTSSGPDGGDPG